MSDTYRRFIALPEHIMGLYFPGSGDKRGTKPVRQRRKRGVAKTDQHPETLMEMGKALQDAAREEKKARRARTRDRLEAEERQSIAHNMRIRRQMMQNLNTN